MLWWLLCYALIVQALALQQRDLIINGTIAPEQRYPYAVFLQEKDFVFCGGSLIAEDVVLTAAHCIPDPDNVKDITIVVGEYNVTDDVFGDMVKIREIVLHPLYMLDSGNDKDFDIALTFLDRPTTIAKVSLVHLNRENSYPPGGTIATYLGWGMVNTKGEVSTVLREVDVSVMTNEECNQISGTIYNIDYSFSGRITPNMMCTFTPGKDSCQRDSGGPLIVRGEDASSDIQIGVSSWGVSCASDVFPGVVSRVSYSWNFIRENVCSNSSMPPDDFECHKIGEPSFQPTSVAPTSKSPSLNHSSQTPSSVSQKLASNAQKPITNIVAVLAMGIACFFCCVNL
jgi:secreted trypsin-like serine protease